jgi:hypothetical protein
MQLTDFCAQSEKILAQQPSVILFKSKFYSPLSFAQILKWMQTLKIRPADAGFAAVQKLDLDQDFNQLTMQLHTTFLGQTNCFWFADLALLSSKKKRADWLLFLQTYHGPHQIIGWLAEDDAYPINSTTVLVSVPELYSSDQLSKLPFLYIDHKPEIAAYFFGRLYRTHKELSLEQLCLLQHYAGTIGKNMDLFFDQWLDQLIIGDISLFYVAQLFLQKRADLFFIEWHKVRGFYSDQFWTVFFSDQLFKAYFYVTVQGRIDPQDKAMTYGLPFSFLKTDWKLYQKESLLCAHEKLYEVDVALKTGGSTYLLDSFVTQFFA